MTDRDALLLAIIADPADDTPRLAFADWCEEMGGEARAEFIRVQVELEVGDCRVGRSCSKCGRPFNSGHDEDCPWPERFSFLRRRERELWEAGVDSKAAFRWFPGLPGDVFLDAASPIVFLRFPGNRQDARLDVRRGFPSRARFLTTDFLAHAAELFAAQPVEAVRLADKRPRPPSASWGLPGTYRGWWSDEELALDMLDEKDDLPFVLWEALDGHIRTEGGWEWFDSDELALAALSAACVAHGRHLAGLPPARVRP